MVSRAGCLTRKRSLFGALTSVSCLFDSVLVPIIHQVPGFGTQIKSTSNLKFVCYLFGAHHVLTLIPRFKTDVCIIDVVCLDCLLLQKFIQSSMWTLNLRQDYRDLDNRMTVQALAASTFSLKAISMFLWRFNESLNELLFAGRICV